MNHILCSRCSPWPVVALFAVSAVVFSSFAGSFLYQGICSSTELEFEESVRGPLKGPEYPPIFAYWITGTRGEHRRILRLLKAVYHPRNRYLLQLDAGSTTYERVMLANLVRSERVFRAFGNVHVMGRAYPIDRSGPSSVSAMLHAAAVLLKIGADWDWFIRLSASDYPLVTQDDLLHVFSSLPRDLNFIEHALSLERPSGGVVPGKWCADFADDLRAEDSNDRCSSWSDIDAVERGLSGEKLANFVSELVSENILQSKYCN